MASPQLAPQYSFTRLTADIKADLAKYTELFCPTPSAKRLRTMRVLLSSPGFFVVAGYRIRFWLKTKSGDTSNLLLKIFLKLLLKFFNRVVGVYSVVVMKTQIFGWPFIGPGLYLSNRGASWTRTGWAPGSVKAVILNFVSLEHLIPLILG